MPVEMFPDGLEPPDPDAVIWRFMDLWKFERLLNDGALYFRRADLFLDQYEGLLPESRPLSICGRYRTGTTITPPTRSSGRPSSSTAGNFSR